MEIYISVLEEEARQEEREPDLRQVGEREEGMRKEYERACLIAQECLAEHQNMSDIRRGLSIGNTQQPRAQPADNAAAVPNAPGRLYKANGEFKPDTLTKDSSAGQVLEKTVQKILCDIQHGPCPYRGSERPFGEMHRRPAWHRPNK